MKTPKTDTPPPESDLTGLLPLTPAVLHILLALADGERHGYAIMQDVEAQTAGSLRMGPGTLYGSLKRMLTAGLVEEMEGRSDTGSADRNDERRRYYRLTDLGERVLQAEVRRLQQIVRLPGARRLLEGYS